MNDRRVAGTAALATLALAAVRYGTELSARRLLDAMAGGTPLPSVGSVGQTATAYVSLFDGLVALVTAGLTLALGVSLGRRVDVRGDHRALLRAVATGSGAVVALATLGMLAAGGVADVAGVALALAVGVRLTAELTVPLLVGTLAGAALVTFEGDGDDAGSTGASTDGDHGATADAARGSDEPGAT